MAAATGMSSQGASRARERRSDRPSTSVLALAAATQTMSTKEVIEPSAALTTAERTAAYSSSAAGTKR